MSRVFLITGASSGIGAATARQAVAAGHRVVLGARSNDRIDALAEELGGAEHAVAQPLDVTDWDAQRAIFARAREAFGGVDVVLANAGIGGPRSFEEIEAGAMRDMILTNVLGVALTAKAAIPALRESRGHLVLTSSIAGRRALEGSLYSATKFAVTAMGEAVRLELNDTGVRVTLIEPGMVETEGFSHELDEPLVADDVARAILWAAEQPPHMDVNEIMLRPTAQRS